MKLSVGFIPELEKCTDSEVLNAMLEQEAHAVSNVNWAAEYPYAPNVSFRIAHTADSIVIMFEVEEDHVKAVEMQNHGKVWQDSCVEFFVGNPCGEGYFNFEVNCIGTILAAKRTSRIDPAYLSEDKVAQIRRITSLERKPVDSEGEGQKWWMIEMIPFALLGLSQAPQALKANFYKCGDCCSKPHFLSWSPIDLPSPDFHCPAFFGDLELM